MPPKGFDFYMLFHPFKEEFYQPPMLVQKSNIGCSKMKAVRVIDKAPSNLRGRNFTI